MIVCGDCLVGECATHPAGWRPGLVCDVLGCGREVDSDGCWWDGPPLCAWCVFDATGGDAGRQRPASVPTPIGLATDTTTSGDVTTEVALSTQAVDAFKSVDSAAEDVARAIALLEEASRCDGLDAGQREMLGEAADRACQVLAELSTFESDFEDDEEEVVSC